MEEGVSRQDRFNAGAHVQCPICLDLWTWDGRTLYEKTESGSYSQVDIDGITDSLKRADLAHSAYVRCPNSSGDVAVEHYLPAEYVRHGPPLVIGLVGAPAAGKTLLLAAMIGEIEKGGLQPYGLSARPANAELHHDYLQGQVMPFLDKSKELAKTQVSRFADFADVLLVSGEHGTRVVAFFDVAGESFVPGRQDPSFLLAADALIFVADGAVVARGREPLGDPAHSVALGLLEAGRAYTGRPDLVAAVAVTKSDLFAAEQPVSTWLRRAPRPPSADRFHAETLDVCAFLDANSAGAWLQPTQAGMLSTMHFVSAAGTSPFHGEFSSVQPLRVLEPLVAIFAMTGVLQGPALSGLGRWERPSAAEAARRLGGRFMLDQVMFRWPPLGTDNPPTQVPPNAPLVRPAPNGDAVVVYSSLNGPDLRGWRTRLDNWASAGRENASIWARGVCYLTFGDQSALVQRATVADPSGQPFRLALALVGPAHLLTPRRALGMGSVWRPESVPVGDAHGLDPVECEPTVPGSVRLRQRAGEHPDRLTRLVAGLLRFPAPAGASFVVTGSDGTEIELMWGLIDILESVLAGPWTFATGTPAADGPLDADRSMTSGVADAAAGSTSAAGPQPRFVFLGQDQVVPRPPGGSPDANRFLLNLTLMPTPGDERDEVAAYLVRRYVDGGPGAVEALWEELELHQGIAVDRLVRSVVELARTSEHAGYVPDVASGDDLLNVTEDVSTLARLLLARDVAPPISVGIFGDWGSGKSSFMEQMREYIGRLARQARRGGLEGADTGFCADVRQVRFNAWHYVDANLWATLAAAIFDGLLEDVAGEGGVDREHEVLRELDSVRALREELERQRDEARQRLQAASRDLRERPIGLGEVARAAPITLGSERLSRPLAQRLRDTMLRAGVRAGEINELDLRELGSQIRGLGRLRFLLRRGTWPVRVLLVAALAVTVGAPALAWLLHDALLAPAAAAVAILVAGVPVAVFVGRQLTRVGAVLDAAGEIVRVVDERQQAPIKARQASLSQLIEKYEEQIVSANAQIELLNQTRSVRAFIVERHAAGGYRQQEGVVSAVRRDLERLSDLLAPRPGGIRSARAPEVERIVLYIDDLDRCPSSRVVEVLQAIHLLLAFPLFVVVVGVDVQWLLGSLRQHYRELLRNGGASDVYAGRPADNDAAPYSYLEKIFQIPFCLRPMSAGGYEQLIRALVPVRAEPPDPGSPPADHGVAPSGPAVPQAAAEGPRSGETLASGSGDVTSPSAEPSAASRRSADDKPDGGPTPRGAVLVGTYQDSGPILAVVASRDGTRVLSVDAQGRVRERDVRERGAVSQVHRVDEASSALVTYDGYLLLTQAAGRAVLFDSGPLTVITEFRVAEDTAELVPTVVAVGPRARDAVIRWDSSDAGSVRPNAASTRGQHCTWSQVEPAVTPVSSSAPATTYTHLITRSWRLVQEHDGAAVRFVTPYQEAPIAPLEHHTIVAAITDPDAMLLVTVDDQSVARVWQVGTADEPTITMLRGAVAERVAVSRNGWLAGARGGHVDVHDVRTGRVHAAFTANADVTCMSFTHDGRRLVVGCSDGTVEVRRVAESQDNALLAAAPTPLTAAELDYLIAVGPLIATPRAAKRLTNTYRLLRAGLRPAEMELLLGPSRGYRSAILLLALVVGVPSEGAALVGRLLAGQALPATVGQVIEELTKTAEPAGLAGSAHPGSSAGPTMGDDAPATLTRLHAVRTVIDLSDHADALRYWAPHVARFSFRIRQPPTHLTGGTS